jgi:signal transduction histidine kinase
MIRDIYQHHSSRVIAIGRIVLALLFALWVWIDPQQPMRGGVYGHLLLVAYVGYACAMFPIAWADWWLDYRFSSPSFVLDILVFLVALYCTDGEQAGFSSAYFAFFVFITLSAALRRNWRITLAIALLVAALYVAVGLWLRGDPSSIEVFKVLRRASYLVAVSLIVTWFAVQRSSPTIGKFMLPPAASAASPYEGALVYAMAATGATGAALAWESLEEPGSTLQLAGRLAGGTRHLSPEDLDVFADPGPTLFDRGRGRLLKLGPDGGLSLEKGSDGPRLASFLGLVSGMSFPIEGATGFGQLTLIGIPGLCRDHLNLGEALAREIAHGLDEEEISSMARETAAVRLRGNIARDLHDSVAQSLAGAGYRLASLRQQLRDGKDVLPEIDAISESLHAEQAHIREIIARLRSDTVNPGARDLGTELDRLTNALSRHWQVDVRNEDSVEPLLVPAWLVFEIQQLVREGIANAVRHGMAKVVSVRAERVTGGLSLAITDDGKGFSGEAADCLPKSLAERVEALGGKMAVASIGNGTRIGITLPLGGRP